MDSDELARGFALDSAHPLVSAALETLGLAEGERPAAVLPRDRSRVDATQVSASQRWRLILATAHVVARQGYAAATIDKITSQAGVSKKTFYKFFPSKESAFLACYEAVDGLLGHVTALAADQSDLDAAADAVITAYLSALAAAPDLTRLFLIEALAATPRIRLKRAENLERFAAVLQDGLAAVRRRDPSVARIPDHQVIALLGGINELCVNHITRHPIADLPAMKDAIVAFTRRFLGSARTA